MIIGLIIFFIILGFVFVGIGCSGYDRETLVITGWAMSWIIALVIFIFGCFHGFISYPPTEGTHQGVITAVDLEGNWFRRYEVYLKSSGYTEQSDETVYKVYVDETELIEELKNAIGKEVKLHYGHDGGYIAWNSCGTYHIKDVEIVEEEK